MKTETESKTETKKPTKKRKPRTPVIKQDVIELVAVSACEQATGCRGAGGYREFAKSHGFPHCEVYDWTSSAGDWTFIVSKDGVVWHVMFQVNNYPRAGYSYGISRDSIDVECEDTDIVSQRLWELSEIGVTFPCDITSDN